MHLRAVLHRTLSSAAQQKEDPGTPTPFVSSTSAAGQRSSEKSRRRSIGPSQQNPPLTRVCSTRRRCLAYELHGPVLSPVGPARQPGKKRKDEDAAPPSASPSSPASSVSQPGDAARTPRPTARPRMPLRARRPEPRLALRTRRDTTGLTSHRALTAPASRPHHTATRSSSRTFPSRAPTLCHGWTPCVRLPHPDDRSRP